MDFMFQLMHRNHLGVI